MFKKIFIVYHIYINFGKYGKAISIIFVPVVLLALLFVEQKVLGNLDPISRIKNYALGYDVSFDEKMLIYLYFYLLANLVYVLRLRPENTATIEVEEKAVTEQAGSPKNEMKKSSAVEELKERIKESGEGIRSGLSTKKAEEHKSGETQKEQRRKENFTVKPTRPISEEEKKELEEVLQGTLWKAVKSRTAVGAVDKARKKEEILSKMNRKL